jgi:hypothetical protein
MEGPLGVLLEGLTVAMTEVEVDIDGGPPVGVSIPSCVQRHIGSSKAKHVKQ